MDNLKRSTDRKQHIRYPQVKSLYATFILISLASVLLWSWSLITVVSSALPISPVTVALPSVHVPLTAVSSMPLPFYQIESLLLATVFFSLGLGGWLLHPFHKVARVVFILSQVTTAMFSLMTVSLYAVPVANQALTVCVLLIPPLVLHVQTLFPNPLPERLARRLRSFVYAGLALMLILAFAPDAVSRLGVTLRLSQLIQNLYFLITLTAGILLPFYQPVSPSFIVRQRRRLLLIGMITSVAPILILSFIPVMLNHPPILDYFWTFPFIAIAPIVYAYAVHAGELGRIERVLNRTIVYMLVIISLLVLYMLSFTGLNGLFGYRFSDYPLMGGVLSIIIGLSFNPLRQAVQRQIDKLFYGGWYDYRSVVRRASAELSFVLTLEQLTQRLLFIIRMMRFESAVFLWENDETFIARGSFGCDPALLDILQRSLDCRVIRPRLEVPQPYLLREVLTGSDKHPVETACPDEIGNFHLVLPLVSHHVLYGLVVLSQRQGEILIEQIDRDILTTFTQQASIAAENIALLMSQQNRLLEMESVRDELAETQRRLMDSREAERIYIAHELHDGPLQDLYGARYQLQAALDKISEQTQHASVARVQLTLQTISDSLRTLCNDLRPPALSPFGLEVAIRSHSRHLSELYPTLQITLDLVADGQLLPERTRSTLFRVYQEAMSNVIKHAQADQIKIRFQLDCDQVQLCIQDNGRGFIRPERWLLLARQGHLGLLGAVERIESIGGHLEIQSELGQGTSVDVRVPLIP